MRSRTVENPVQTLGRAGAGPAPRAAEPDYCRCDTLVLGCGNELFGDDGFGPAVARALARRRDLPPSAAAMDVGTGARQVLFNIVLSPRRPRRIVVVDAVDRGRTPGKVWTMKARDLPEVKCDDFSMHQLPTSNLLRELEELGGVEVTCVVAQVSPLPGEVRPGLSAPLRRAVERAREMILKSCRGRHRPSSLCARPAKAVPPAAGGFAEEACHG